MGTGKNCFPGNRLNREVIHLGKANVYTLSERGDCERTLEDLLETLLLNWAMNETGQIGSEREGRQAYGTEKQAPGGPVSSPFQG